MKTRTVELVASPREPHFVGDGFRVHNFIPSGFRMDMERMDPFILLDYNSKYEFPASEKPKGVDVHPHRGFETVTIAYQGSVAHNDSNGGGGVISQGDVQWMTAASGVLHKEFHEKEWSKKGGLFQMVQLWVNLPAQYKMSAPKYQAIKNADIPRYTSEGVEIEVIAGDYKEVAGIASTFSPVNMLNVKLSKGATADFSFPAHYNTAVLVIEGNVLVNNTDEAPTDHFVLMENDGETFRVTAQDDAIVLVLSGEPLNEPIVAYGPFVMNTREEIVQAFEDVRAGKFGHLD
ncbi:pirin family protein [Capnocytophaga sp. oral taxon 902]|jgi:pirin family protein|uniref:Pirin family protein n=1 Tax=Capnocytophaga ochracea TaxID=1018 RepID=A0AA46ZZQ6_CAPOC|nr:MULTISPECIES: pirin family protein [Capnocytophaga]QLF51077.1 pirin family protein [Capnocytophaga sp. oral taxon 902]UZD41483.1 pirin family protein [Capnocytophaga ochracea]